MSTAPTEPLTPTAPTAPAAQPEAPKPDAAPAQETDWKAEARKWEQRAKDNKLAADKLAAIEEANKTEAQKLADQLTAAKQEAIEAKREAFAATKGVPVSLVTGSTPEQWEAAVTEALAWKGAAAAVPPVAPSAAGQGNVGKPIGSGTQAEQLQQQIDAASKAGRHAEAIALKRQLASLTKPT